jgi:hypothetical protein
VDPGLSAVFLLAGAGQVAAAPAPEPAPPRAMLTAEPPALVLPRALADCPRAAGSEIVVCGQRDADARYRLPEAAPGPDPDQPRNVLGLQISENVSAHVDPVQYQLPNGMIARGVVARVRIGF